jgi:membrane protease YdiL (CAAX protease family)
VSEFQLSTILAILCVALLALVGRIPYIVEFSSLWRRALAALLFTEILTIAVFMPVSMQEPQDFDPQYVWFPALFAGHVAITLFLFVWWRLRGDIPLSKFLSLSSGRLGEKLWQGVLYGLGCWLFAITATVTMGSFAEAAGGASQAAPPEIVVWMATLPLSRKLIIVLVSMTVEEAFFRSFLQPRVGLVTTSILFALGHSSYGLPLLVVGVFAVALVIGRCFERTGDLLPCIVAHAVFNGVQLLIILPWVVASWETMPH